MSNWFQIRFSTLLLLVVIGAMAAAWWRDRRELETRLAKLENASNPTGLSADAWSLKMAFGPPDEPGMGVNAWCPASTNGTKEWLQLDYGRPINPRRIDIYETYATGGIYRVTVFDGKGREQTVWRGRDPTPPGAVGTFRIPVATTLKARRVKLYFHPQAQGWNCVDAVGVRDGWGRTHWATGGKASSTYGTQAGGSLIGGGAMPGMPNQGGFSAF